MSLGKLQITIASFPIDTSHTYQVSSPTTKPVGVTLIPSAAVTPDRFLIDVISRPYHWQKPVIICRTGGFCCRGLTNRWVPVAVTLPPQPLVAVTTP